MTSDMSDYRSELTRKHEAVIAPLSQEEEAQAITAVTRYLDDEDSDETGRRRILGVEMLVEKSQRQGHIPLRKIHVVVADYRRGRIRDLLIDGAGDITTIEHPHGFRPPFSPHEIEEAREIAEDDNHVAALAKAPGAFVSVFGPDEPVDSGTRLIGLRYVATQRSGAVTLLASVIVDLVGRRLLSFEAGALVEREGGTS